MKVFLYMRVSSEEQARHGYSLDAQETALKDFCERNDHVIVGIYKDEGISGRKPYTKRPAMVQLLQDIETVHPDMILFTKLDRWFRNIKDYYKVQDILEKNKVFWKAINEEYDTSTASGRLYVNIKLSIAQDEADRTSERIKDVQSQLVAQGIVLCGTAPFGYKIENKRLVFGDKIDIVKDLVEHYMLHRSLHMTVRYSNEKYGTTFNCVRLKRLFINPLLKGEYRQNPSFCEPLLTPEQWDDLQEVIKNNIKHASVKNIYFFSGLMDCPICGVKLSGCHDRNRKYYRCQQHYIAKCTFARNINEKKVEAWLLDNIEDDFKIKVTQKPKQKKESPQKYRDRLRRLNDIYLLGNISESEYKQKTAELQKKIADLSKVRPVKEVTFEKNWREVYNVLDDERKRSFWHSLIAGVKIDQDGNFIEIMY